MTPLRLQIEQWAAWAPGLESHEAWRQWLREPVELVPTGAPALAEMPAMMRRRIEPLGRVALQAAYWAQGPEPTGPVVFASRWGELARSVELLQHLAAGEPLSPTAFSLSVHNAVGALYSIARKDRHNYQALSAGEFSAEAGFVEAMGLLADGAERVLLVYFDCPLPKIYARFESREHPLHFPHAFACLLKRAESGGISLSTQTPKPTPPGGLPAGLEVLRFLLDAEQAELRRGASATHWIWTRHAG